MMMSCCSSLAAPSLPFVGLFQSFFCFSSSSHSLVYFILSSGRPSFVGHRPYQVSILASRGDRPRGSMYLLACSPPRAAGMIRSISEIRSGYSSSSSSSSSTAEENSAVVAVVVEGLALEEEGSPSSNGVVRVVVCPSSSSGGGGGGGGIFSGMRFNKGDRIYGVNGMDVSSIDDFRAALSSSLGTIDDATTTTTTTSSLLMIPVLTYNPYRRVRSALMTVTLSNAFVRVGEGFSKIDVVGGGRSGRTDEGKPMVRIDDRYAIGEKVRKRIRVFCSFVSYSLCR